MDTAAKEGADDWLSGRATGIGNGGGMRGPSSGARDGVDPLDEVFATRGGAVLPMLAIL